MSKSHDGSAPAQAGDYIGRVQPDGRIDELGATWRWLHAIKHIGDLAAPDHRARVDEALAAAARDGRAEVDADFRVGGAPFRWRFQQAESDGLDVMLHPLDPGTATESDGSQQQQDFATNRIEILKRIAHDDDLVAVLYELIGAIEQFHPRLTAAIQELREGHLHVRAAPGLDNACIQAMHQRPPSHLGGPIQTAISQEQPVTAPRATDVDSMPRELAAAMRTTGYSAVMALPVRNRAGAVLGLLTVFVAEHADMTEPVAKMLEEMAQITSVAFEQQSLTEQLLRQAHYDPLTQLPNRTLLNDRIEQLILDAGRSGATVAVLMLDLDEFKLVNDSFGHVAGDNLLQQVANRLSDHVRASDTVARFGGDEFVVITPLGEAGQATDISQRILEALQPSFLIEDRNIDARPSIGISLFPQDSLTPEGLVQAADTAMYTAKMAGKNRYHFFSASMNAEVSRRLRIEGELRRALTESELTLFYQPMMSLADEKVVGAEALIRWHHPEHGLMLPGSFLPVAEQSELVNDIDHYVLERAMFQVAEWCRSGHELLMSLIITSLNVSARGLHEDGFAARVGRLLRNTGVDPHSIELEITESMIMRDFDAAVTQLRSLKESAPGLRIAIDDFGTGHASFAYLRQLPVDTLKIDMSFITDLDNPANSKTARAIVKTIVALGRNLNLTVVAEGVETSTQAEFLRKVGCHRAQGYFFSYPLDVDGFEAFVL